MKKLLTLSLVSLLAVGSYAQVELGKTKNTIMGKGKIVAEGYEDIMFDSFSLMINLYKFEEDQGGSNNVALSSKVGVRASLTDVDEALIKEITNEAYAYFVESWEKRGKKLTYPPKAQIEASKPFSKAKSKGKLAQFINGTVWDNNQKKLHQMWAWPDGVDIPQAGEGLTYKAGNAAFIQNYLDMKYTSFSAQIDFIKFKTAKLGSTASVKSIPRLTCASNLSISQWKKNKIGAYLGGGSAEGLEEYYSDVKDENIEVLNSKMVMRNYVVDREKFKANVLEMIKATMDDQFRDYDEVVSKNS